MSAQEPNAIIPLGEAPAILAKRPITKPCPWCPKPVVDLDKYCDPDCPKTIAYKDVCIAATALNKFIDKTPLVRSKCCVQFGLELNYKIEILHKTGSFHERTALYCIYKLNKSQRSNGIYTVSLGNWAIALAYHTQRLHIPLTVVLPEGTMENIVEKCKNFGATVVIHGENLDAAKKQAFALMNQKGSGVFINGYDHPNVIAASGIIGKEILEELPQTDAILVPVGGGALLAGIAVAVKYLKPSILVYGVEPHKCCCFFKALENKKPYQTQPVECIAGCLGVSTAGHNSFHTAKSLIDKMVLADDDWITRAIHHLSDEEKYVVDGAGAAPLSVILAYQDILPELKGKTVVCVVSGGNINLVTFTRAIDRAKAIEGITIKLTVTMRPDDTKLLHRISSMIANIGCTIHDVYRRNCWFNEGEVTKVLQTFICEAKNLKHACTLKRVMERLFPGICDFYDEPFSPIQKCACFPVRVY